MKRPSKDFPGQAFLEMLRPPKLASTRLALFCTYSADPIVLGAALLNLHARGRDDASGNKSDFAGAIEALRDRVRFIVQRGRIHRGPKLPKIAAVLDQFVEEMRYPESSSSWHPKAALICYETKTERLWRLWVGSRNLTTSRDLDLGLVLDGESRRRKGSRFIDGVDELGATLAREAKLQDLDPEAVKRDLGAVRWTAPEGIDVSRIDLWVNGSLPAPPFAQARADRVVVLSPFLCDAFARSLAAVTSSCADRTLVTTLPALRKLKPGSRAALAGFRLLSLGTPVPDGVGAEEGPRASGSDPASDEEDEGSGSATHSGLHAKLFAAITGEQIAVVAGSANATDRAWSGRNAEVVARFNGGRREIDGVAAIIGSAMPIPQMALEMMATPEVDDTELQLERVRWALADWPFRLARDGKRYRLTCDAPPSWPVSARLDVGLATTTLHSWKPGATEIDFGEIPLSLQTDLVQFRLALDDHPPATWLLRVPVSPEIDADRDAAAISRLLSVAGLQRWLREMLEGEAGAGADDDWDDEPDSGSKGRASWKHDGFALEDILSAWAKEQVHRTGTLKRVDAMLDRYVAAVLAYGEQLTSAERDDLLALQQTWRTARDVLIAR